MKKHLNQIEKLRAELAANGGVVPNSWLPYIHLIELGLNMAMLFTNDEWDKIIKEILAAIDLLENA